MPEYTLTPTPALGTGAPACVSHGDYQLCEVADLAIASVSCRAGQSENATQSLKAHLGLDALPGPGKSAASGPFRVFWSAPDQWMITAPHGSHEMLAAEMKNALGASASVTEQNDGWACFELTGPDLTPVFERLANFDAGKLSTGDALRTVIDHTGCFVLCLDHPTHARLFCLRSFARSFHHAIAITLRSTRALLETA